MSSPSEQKEWPLTPEIKNHIFYGLVSDSGQRLNGMNLPECPLIDSAAVFGKTVSIYAVTKEIFVAVLTSTPLVIWAGISVLGRLQSMPCTVRRNFVPNK